MCSNEVKGFQFFRHFFSELGGISTDLEFSTIAVVFSLCVIKNVDTKFCGHVQTIVWTYVNAHLACCTGLPDDSDSSVVVSGYEQPWLHVLKALVRILNRLRLPQTREQIRCYSVGCKFLL